MVEDARSGEHEFGVHPAGAQAESTRVVKDGRAFAVFDVHGDCRPAYGQHGVYYDGTRFLSRYLLRLDGRRPVMLSSTVKRDNSLLSVNLTNADRVVEGRRELSRGDLHLLRTRLLWDGVAYDQLRLRSFADRPVRVTLSLELAADFADIFEVRGTERPERGVLEGVARGGEVLFAYRGLDGLARRTRVACDPPPARATIERMDLEAQLAPGQEATFLVTVSCEAGEERRRPLPWDEAYAALCRSRQDAWERYAHLRSANPQFNDWVRCSLADLCMMETATPEGPYVHAGVPWYDTPFGRDGIITALECLWVNPDLARGVLEVLARTQATDEDAENDAEPGKIVHEIRSGEMAALGEVPFGRYYGTVDATPLFVMLAGAWYERTGDLAYIRHLWPSLERALAWIDTYGDRDGDGFVEYQARTPRGLSNQGWKDSWDSVFHADGRLAEGPIALCEVQGYVYAAKRAAAELAYALGDPHRAAALHREAAALQGRFEDAFWCEDLGTYAIALDGRKRPCCVRTSNPGHCLFAGIASPERAERVTAGLLHHDLFSGWGIRTVANGEARYNPMAYHNGSIWPHDNAICAAGMARYGLKDAAMRLFAGLFEASQFIELHRLPELFCGFTRRPGEGPTPYPVACSPQAWASGAVLMVLQSMLGIQVSAPARQVRVVRPRLPESLERLTIEGLRFGDAAVDLMFYRHDHDVGVNVLGRTGMVDILTVR